jgi:sugar/nucleoside kinase (ribokinase family)
MSDFLVSISNIFIDDILTWRDEVFLGALGGAGLHALSGARIWREHLGIIACAGDDFRPFLPELHTMGIDTAGIQYTQEKTNRQWEIFQPGEVRIGVLRDPRIPKLQAVPDFDQLPTAYGIASGYHILWQGEEKDLFAVLADLRKRNPQAVIVYEPSIIDCHWGVDFFKRLFPYIDAFSPALAESRQILGLQEPQEIIKMWLQLGCRLVALRLGSQGSLAGDVDGNIYQVPATPAKVVDVTGAGNAYCGGLSFGLVAHKTIRECLAMASVSASFEIEQYGLCRISSRLENIRNSRMREIFSNIKMI